MKMSPRHLAATALAFLALSCASVETPKGTSRGYTSARLVRAEKPAPAADQSAKINRMIQKSLAENFRANNLSVGNPDADLIVGYLVLVQDNVSTAAFDDYFGYGRDSDAIVDKAQIRRVVENESTDKFEAGTIVVDVMDAKTNKLVYRNYARRDIYRSNSDSARQQRIDEAVTEALAPFFK